MKYTCEAYEDNAGDLHLFAVDDKQSVAWGRVYDHKETETAAIDWIKLMVYKTDPAADGWTSSEDITEDYTWCYENEFQIASSNWVEAHEYPFGIDTNVLGEDTAGQRFAINCGMFVHILANLKNVPKKQGNRGDKK